MTTQKYNLDYHLVLHKTYFFGTGIMKNYFYILFFCIALLVSHSCDDPSKVKSVFLSPENMQLSVGETRQIEMFALPLSSIAYNSAAWISSNPDVAVVDSKGNVTAVYSGECMIIGQMSNVYDTCFVKVVTPTYKIDFNKMTMYDADSEDDKKLIVLRLHDNSLSFDKEGNAIGNGLFLNLCLYIPISRDSLPLGDFVVSNSGNQYTVAPGEITQTDGRYYVTGSYLGQYTVDGLSVVRVAKGDVNIAFEGSYIVDCKLFGADNEKIDVNCIAIPNYYRGDDTHDVQSIYYTDYLAEEMTLQAEPSVNHIKLTLNCVGDTSVVFLARVPLSVNYLPSGKYVTADDIYRSFTLLSTSNTYQCTFVTGDTQSVINDATLSVTRDEDKKYLFEAHFSTIDNSSFVVSKADNIRKVKINPKQTVTPFFIDESY